MAQRNNNHKVLQRLNAEILGHQRNAGSPKESKAKQLKVLCISFHYLFNSFSLSFLSFGLECAVSAVVPMSEQQALIGQDVPNSNRKRWTAVLVAGLLLVLLGRPKGIGRFGKEVIRGGKREKGIKSRTYVYNHIKVCLFALTSMNVRVAVW